MKYCSNCGTQLDDSSRFCTNCGAAYIEPAEEVKEVAPEAVTAEPTIEEAAAPFPTPEPEPDAIAPEQADYYQEDVPVSRGKSITGLVFGAVGLGTSWLGIFSLLGLISTVLCIVGLILSGRAYKETGSKMARTGRILALIGLILSIILTVIFTLLYIVALVD